jgi:hypothetical protein
MRLAQKPSIALLSSASAALTPVLIFSSSPPGIGAMAILVADRFEPGFAQHPLEPKFDAR